MLYQKSKPAIALLLTLVFIMLITVSLGVGLKYVKKSTQTLNDENFMFQVTTVVDDFVNILKSSAELTQVTDSDALTIFLQESSLLPFESQDMRVIIEMKSARAKINPNSFNTAQKISILKNFLLSKMVNPEYANMLSDSINGIKEDNVYNSDLFVAYPDLFRDYIASETQLQKLNDIYKIKYHEESLKNIDFNELFYTSKDKNSTIDLNYATPPVWELMIGCTQERADVLAAGSGTYQSVVDLSLTDTEKIALSHFNTSYFSPILDVSIHIHKNSESAFVRFEYNILTKKGSNFVFKV
jgi:flagellar biosynthesis protein FliP